MRILLFFRGGGEEGRGKEREKGRERGEKWLDVFRKGQLGRKEREEEGKGKEEGGGGEGGRRVRRRGTLLNFLIY